MHIVCTQLGTVHIVRTQQGWVGVASLYKNGRAKPTSESYNDPLKVLTKGSMVEYLPVGSQEAPQTIIGKKNFQLPRS